MDGFAIHPVTTQIRADLESVLHAPTPGKVEPNLSFKEKDQEMQLHTFARPRNFLFVMAIVVVVTTANLSVSFAADAAELQAKVLDSFVVHVDQLETIDDGQKKNVHDTLAKYADSPQDAMTESLFTIYPEYVSAVAASDDDDLSGSIAQLSPLADSADLFLAADASFYLARTLMNNQRFEDALPRLQKLLKELANYSVHQGDAQYFVAVAQAGLLDKENAIESFYQFLQFNPNSAERLRVSAWRQIQQLQAIKDGELADIHHHMDFSRRRLELIETDETTQKEQDDIVRMLAKMIKEKEKEEASASGKSKSKNTKQQESGQPSAPKPGEGNGPGQSQQGGNSSNPNGQAVKKTFNDSPASPWSRLRDRSRDPANNAIKDKLPARYRDIVERYIQAINEEE